MLNLGDLNTSETAIIPFSTFGGSAESITITGLAVTDIEVFKDGSATTRASDNGYTLLDTDGIDFASITGVHGISIDLSDNSDAGFYANGSSYFVVISAITVNAQTVSFVAATFTIGRSLRPTTAGRTLDIQATGEADVNLTLVGGSTVSQSGGLLNATAIAGTAAFFQDFFTVDSTEVSGSEVSGSAILEIAKVVWDRILSGATHNIATSAGRRLRQLQESGSVYNGQVWVDTVNGVAGTEPYENGTSDNHVDLWASAISIAPNVNGGLLDFHIINGSSIDFTGAAVDNYSIFGNNYTLVLGGVSCQNLYAEGAMVSGTGTAAAGEMHFEGCDVSTMSVQSGHFDFCGFSGTVTQTLAGDYNYHECKSKVAGAGAPTFTKTAGQTITAEFRNWAGGITISGLQSGDVVTVGGTLGTVTLNGADASVEIRGTYKNLVNNLTGTPTVNTDGAIKGVDVASILTDTTVIGPLGAGLTDITINAASVDLIYDEVNTGATHGIANSGGKQWRSAATTGLYEGGQIWIDTVNGSPGTDVDENGTMDSNSSNIADATTLLTAKGHSRFKIAPGSSFTLTQAYTNIIFEGDDGATIALGGQAITGCVFRGVIVTGTATGTGTIKFDNCLMGTDVLTCTLPPCHIDNSKIINDITSNAAGDYFFDKCSSGMAGTATWTFDFGGAIGTTNLNVRFNSGGIQLENMGDVGTDIASFEGFGQIIEGTCTAGTVAVRGLFTRSFLVTDNITWSEDARIDTPQILAQVNAALGTSIAELSQGVPTATPTLRTGLMLMYMALRNKLDVQTSGTDALEVHNDAGTLISKKLLTDDGADYSEAKMISGA